MGTHSPVCNFGWMAPDFDLPATDGNRYALANVRGASGLLVMFICNHCPYVKAIRERLIRDCKELAALGIGAVAINANDPADYPEDSFANMQRIVREFAFPFPYLFDETQAIARAYGAFARRNSLASTVSCSSNITAAWTPPGPCRSQTPEEICSRR